jgi:GNAT superfamily N-acetyltransferase
MITVRAATLQDTAAITAIHTSDVPEWVRYDAQGHPQPTAYESLTVWERWMHGGAWMSLETCAVHLNRLLAGVGFPLVAELDGQVLATAEVYENFEAAPYDHHLSIGVLYTHQSHQQQGLGSALVDYIVQMARVMTCKRVTVADTDAPDFYTGLGFQQARSGRRIKIPAQAGRAFYQASELTDRHYSAIKGWHMPLGRYNAPRQEWLSLFPQDWAAGLPELLSIKTIHLSLNVAGQSAIVFMKEADDPESMAGECAVACWSPRPLSAPLLAALRDRAYREGFHTLVTFAMDSDWSILLAADATQTPYHQSGYERVL